MAGFKYFDLSHTREISIDIKIHGKLGENDRFVIATDENFTDIVARVYLKNQENGRAELKNREGVLALYFKYSGEATVDFLKFELT